jgi:hypothetical protein
MRMPSMSRATLLRIVTLAVIVALVLVIGLSVSGGSSKPVKTASKPFRTSSFGIGVDRITLTYPSRWDVRPDTVDQTMFSNSVVFLASQPLRDPCSTTYGSPPGPIKSTSCRFAVEELDKGGVYVEWLVAGGPPGPRSLPGAPSTTESGRPISVDGRTAWMQTQTPGPCSYIAGDETITAAIGPRSNDWVMEACIRSPDLEESAAEVMALLGSAKVSGL